MPSTRCPLPSTRHLPRTVSSLQPLSPERQVHKVRGLESRYCPGPQTSISGLLSLLSPQPEVQKPRTTLRLFPASVSISEVNHQTRSPKILWLLGQMKRPCLYIRAKVASLTL